MATGTVRATLLTIIVGCVLATPLCAHAWWAGGHEIVSRAAAGALPDDVPGFFRHSSDALAFYSAEPDLWKNPDLPQLRDAEGPEHFLDYELLEGRVLPPFRWDFVALCGELKRNPRDVGLLPYAVVEWTERLTLAFAAYRRSPDNAQVRQECLLYGGILSHYAADLAQPLHLTIDYDGRTSPGEPSPHTGIHDRMDALIQAAGIQPRELSRDVKPVAFDDLFTSTVQEVLAGRGEIKTVYNLEEGLPPTRKEEGVEPGWKPTERVHGFARDRAQAATFLTASYWLTAWERSKNITAHLPTHAETLRPSSPEQKYRAAWVAAVIGILVLAVAAYRLTQRATDR